MAANTSIEWTDRTWNPIVGCALAPEKVLLEPLRRKKPTTYFVNSMGDLFHEDVKEQWQYLVFAAMSLSYDVASTDERNVISGYKQRHVYQILTKRSARMLDFITALIGTSEQDWFTHPFSKASRAVSQARGDPIWQNALFSSWQWVADGCPGLWLGVSVEDQTRADERRGHLQALAEMGWKTMVSYEPALGPVDWTGWEWLGWLISGSESGPGARPAHTDWDWHRAARDFCQANGIPYFFKQHGNWSEIYDRDRDADQMTDPVELLKECLPLLRDAPGRDAVSCIFRIEKAIALIEAERTKYAELESALNERDLFINPHLLEQAADEIDCDGSCDYVRHGTGICVKADRGEYCPNDVAETLRAVAKFARAREA